MKKCEEKKITQKQWMLSSVNNIYIKFIGRYKKLVPANCIPHGGYKNTHTQKSSCSQRNYLQKFQVDTIWPVVVEIRSHIDLLRKKSMLETGFYYLSISIWMTIIINLVFYHNQLRKLNYQHHNCHLWIVIMTNKMISHGR